MPKKNIKAKDVAATIDGVAQKGRELVDELQRQLDSLSEMADDFLEKGLLGQHVEAVQMRDRVAETLEDTRCRLLPPKAGAIAEAKKAAKAPKQSSSKAVTVHAFEESKQQTTPLAMPPTKPSMSEGNAERADNARVSDAFYTAWVAHVPSIMDDSPKHGAEFQYRWRLPSADGDRCAVLEVLGVGDDPEVDVCRTAVHVAWLERGGTGTRRALTLPLGTEVGSSAECRAEFQRKLGRIMLSFPVVPDYQPPADVLIDGLRREQGHGVLDGFMRWSEADAIRRRLLTLWREGRLRPGEVEAGMRSNVRSDTYAFLNDVDAVLDVFTRALDRLVLRLCQAVPKLRRYKLVRGRPMAAVYAGAGSKYTPHFDCTKGDNGRVLTCLLYLNPFWREGDGAELRLWPDATYINPRGSSHDVAPLHGRLAAFLCDSRNLHEVLPVSSAGDREPRVAISCWYYDASALPRLAAEEGRALPPDAPSQ